MKELKHDILLHLVSKKISELLLTILHYPYKNKTINPGNKYEYLVLISNEMSTDIRKIIYIIPEISRNDETIIGLDNKA